MSESVILASDHNGVALKAQLYSMLTTLGYNPVDIGPFDARESVDYVDFAKQLAAIVASKSIKRGILICGTGAGMSVVANRTAGIRAVLVHNMTTAAKCREHNDANVLCLGSWITATDESLEITKTWLTQEFGEGRHNKRMARIDSAPVGVTAFTNGCFDILHTRHIELLLFARALGDRLVIGLDTDESVRRLKGPERPINSYDDRKRLLMALKCVDEVVEFDSATRQDVLVAVRPTVIVKGGEWTAAQVRERDCISDDIHIVICPTKHDKSTTLLVEKLRTID